MYLLELVGEDDRFSLAEATVHAADPVSIGPGVASTPSIDRAAAKRLARTRRVLSDAIVVEGPQSALLDRVATAALDREGPIAVRARDVRATTGIDTQAVERAVGGVLADRGFEIDLTRPAEVLRVLATADDGAVVWAAGWVEVEPLRSFERRQPPARPFRQPGTMGPQLARTLVNLSGVRPGDRLLDPMCGPGGVLIEAAMLGVSPIGIDVQRKMLEGARSNVTAFAPDQPTLDVIRASASALPVREVDGIVFDAPYGRQSPIAHASAAELVADALEEAVAIADRCVVVFDDRVDGLAEAAGWIVSDVFERPVHRSLTRVITVLDRE